MAIKINGTNTVAAPGMTGADTDTGLVYGTNQVDISTGGSSRVTVDSSGYVGIGTTSPDQPLHVKGLCKFETTDSTNAWVNYAHTDDTYRLNYNGSGNDEIVITTSGQIGLGTASPSSKIHTYNASSDGLQLQTASYQSYVWQIESSGNLFNGSQAGELGLRGQSGIGFCANNGSTAHFRIESDGDLVGTDTSIGSISDSRVKKNVADYTYNLAKFKQLTPKTFDWINPEEHLKDTNVRGFLAQDVKTIDDYWIKETNSVNKLDKELIGEGKALSSKLGASDAMYVSVIKQLIAKIETLETKVAALEAHTHE